MLQKPHKLFTELRAPTPKPAKRPTCKAPPKEVLQERKQRTEEEGRAEAPQPAGDQTAEEPRPLEALGEEDSAEAQKTTETNVAEERTITARLEWARRRKARKAQESPHEFGDFQLCPD